MGWKSTTLIEEKVKFIKAWQSEQYTVSELCKIFGISIIFCPGCHKQNGRHEWMHRDLKAYFTKLPENTMNKQQMVIDSFVNEYNEIRPTESLDMLTPYDVHECSGRYFPRKIVPFDYGYNLRKMKVTKIGSIRWGKYNWAYI